MTKHSLKVLVLILPIAVMTLFIAGNLYNQQAGQSWRIPITGYDPRDLLRGHYLTFRYDWNWKEEQRSCDHEECVLCLSPSEGFTNPYASITDRNAVGQCQSFIEGRFYYGSRFEIGDPQGYRLRRYYIPEQHAKKLDSMLRFNEGEYKFEVSLRVNKSGKAFIQGMFIDDVPLEDWVKNNQ